MGRYRGASGARSSAPRRLILAAFESLNLRYNPFGEVEAEDRAALAQLDWNALREYLHPGTVTQLIGRPGRGKTTRLLTLAQAEPQAIYHRALCGPIPHCDLLLLDEADSIGHLARIRAARAARAVVWATHVDLRIDAWLAGMRTRTLHIGGIDIEQLDLICSRRIEAARRGPGPIPRVGRSTLRALILAHDDDIRAIEGALYERFQNTTGGPSVEV